MSDRRKIALTLSGGGFRATLFHLGVVRFLYDAGMLRDVHRIAAVSGGSVLAAHLVLNWDRYTGKPEHFDSAAQEILDFVASDVRGRVVRRWMLAWVLVLPRLFKRNRWTFTSLLERQYRRIYRDSRLKDLYPTPENARPQVFFNCTSLSTGSPCCFGRSGFMWYEGDVERAITAPETRVAFAVAASSAFPPLFPPIAVSHEILSCDRKEFPNPHYLTDGGVYDNLGIDRLIWYHKQTNDTDLFLISDAEGNFDWDLDAKFTFITTRNIRASDLLMKRVSALEYQSLSGVQSHSIAFKIAHEVQHPADPEVLTPEIQRSLRNVRTDLDAFSSNEIACILRHGYTVARETSIANGLASREAPTFPWKITPGLTKEYSPNLAQIRKSGVRKFRLWSFRDWVSWASLVASVALCMTVVVPEYLGRKQLRQELLDQKSVNQKLNYVAIDYFKQRHRPVQPGISASLYNPGFAGAYTICCIVQSRRGGKRFLILSNLSLISPHTGDAILQPGELDGGNNPSDLVAHLSRFLTPNMSAPNSALGATAELASGVQAINAVAGFGPIQGIAEKLEPGQEVFIAGRTTGVAKGVVDSIEAAMSIPLENGTAVFTSMIILKATTGPLSVAGDSGAPVLTADGKLAAMVFAGSPSHTIAVPIRRVFDALDVELAH